MFSIQPTWKLLTVLGLCCSIISTSFAQFEVRALSGPTSFTGAMSQEDGILTGSAGRYGSTIGITAGIESPLALDLNATWGELGINTAELARTRGLFNAYSAELKLQIPHAEDRILLPWISAGLSIVRQQQLLDLMNSDGVAYEIWDNGSIYNMAQDAPDAATQAQLVAPDYVYETATDVQQSIGVPIRAGLDLNLTNRMHVSLALTVLTGVEASINPREDYNDFLTTAQAGIGIRLGKNYKPSIPDEIAALPKDADADGVKDVDDYCPGTVESAPVDRHGCPIDSDGDGYADYQDLEINSPHIRVNENGVALSEEEWAQRIEIEKNAQVDPAYFALDYERLESDDPEASILTPELADGLTPAEAKLRGTIMTDIESTSLPIPVIASILPTYRVQVGRYSDKLDTKILTDMMELGMIEPLFESDGTFRFVSQSMPNEKEARAFLSEAKALGFDDAFLIGDYNGRAIGLAQARSIEEQLIGTDSAASE
ncbi:MAG: hypothetical protein ACPGYK_07575 [Flavobacteriales bacterium]